MDCVCCERCDVLNPGSEGYFFIHVFSFLSFSMLRVESKTVDDVKILLLQYFHEVCFMSVELS